MSARGDDSNEEILEETMPVLIQSIIEKAIHAAKDDIVAEIVSEIDQRFNVFSSALDKHETRFRIIESAIARQAETMDRVFSSFDKVLELVNDMLRRERESNQRLNDIERRLASLEQAA